MTRLAESSAPFAHRSPLRRLLRALNSSVRVRFHSLVLVATILGVTVIRMIGTPSNAAARRADEQVFQASTFELAAALTTRLEKIRSSLHAADSLHEAGVSFDRLCAVMVRDTGRAYQRLYVLEVDALVICSSVPSPREQVETTRERPYFIAALATGEDQVSGPLVGVASGRLSIVVAHPIRVSGKTVAVAVSSTDLSEIFSPKVNVSQGDRFPLVARDGSRHEPGASGIPELPQSIVQAASLSMESGEPCPVERLDGVAWTCTPVARLGLTVVAGRNVNSVDAIERGAIQQQWIRILGIVVLAVGTALAVDFLFLRRIRRAYDATGMPRLTIGDATSQDEIDALGEFAKSAEQTLRGLRQEVVEHEARRAASERDLLTTIAETVEVRYPFLRNHGDRVGRYARQIAVRLGIEGHELELVEFAARVHDLGKIAIADAVYLKPGRLEPIELAQMQLHPSRGGEMVGRMRTVPVEVAEAIRHHHEQWDGSGYPDGLAGTAIPFWSRIIAVADAYDAMTEERPYRPQALTHAQAMQTLRDGAGNQWDAAVVAAFVDVIEFGVVAPKPGPQAGLDPAGVADS